MVSNNDLTKVFNKNDRLTKTGTKNNTIMYMTVLHICLMIRSISFPLGDYIKSCSISILPNRALSVTSSLLKGLLSVTLTPKKAPKLACFVLYLKIIDIFLKNNICIL